MGVWYSMLHRTYLDLACRPYLQHCRLCCLHRHLQRKAVHCLINRSNNVRLHQLSQLCLSRSPSSVSAFFYPWLDSFYPQPLHLPAEVNRPSYSMHRYRLFHSSKCHCWWHVKLSMHFLLWSFLLTKLPQVEAGVCEVDSMQPPRGAHVVRPLVNLSFYHMT